MNNAVIAALAIVLGLGAWATTTDSDQRGGSTRDSDRRGAPTATADPDRRGAKPIRITKISYDPWVAIKNFGQRTRQLRGWTLRDTSGHVFQFPRFRLRPNTTVTVHTGDGRRTRHDLYWGMDNYAWNNTGGRATLRNRDGRLIDRCRWGNGDGVKDC
jgi:Lamin Tail Domain